MSERDPLPISAVRVGSWGVDGKPVPTVESAICDVCGAWAHQLWEAGGSQGHSVLTDQVSDVRTSRRIRVVVYACAEHAEEVADRLVDKWGGASNHYDTDELTVAVDRYSRAVNLREAIADANEEQT